MPNRVPSWGEIHAALATPMTTSVLLNILAVLCWLAWLAFVVDVARALPRTVRAVLTGDKRPALAVRAGPVHALAVLLVTTAVVAILGHRPAAVATPPSPITTNVVAFAAPDPMAAKPVPVGSVEMSAAVETGRAVVVREPRDGVYDCLWRIADRELGDGARWPEIYRLNMDRPQADGLALTDPNLIHPGWILVLPDTTPAPPADDIDGAPGPDDLGDQSAPAATDSPGAATPPPPDTPTATSTPPSAAAPVEEESPEPPHGAETAPDEASPHAPTADKPISAPGIDLGPGGFVGLGLAAAISTALLVLSRRRRRWYQPGSGHRTDLPVAPVIRTLRIAHLRHTEPDNPYPDDPDADTGERPGWVGLDVSPTPSGNAATSTSSSSERDGVPVGVRDGHELVVNLARSRGLGLIGPGAADAARALLLTLLTSAHDATDPPQVIIPEPDLATLLDPTASGRLPPQLRVVADIDAAFADLESEIMRRARLTTTHPADGSAEPGQVLLVLVATPTPGVERRLQAILDNGSTLGIAGILLDQWRPGATAHVRTDGTVAATNPGPAEQLRGTRLFTLPAPETGDLLTLLHDADPPYDESSTAPGPSESDRSSDGVARPRASPAARSDPVPTTAAPNPAMTGSAVLIVAVLGPPRLTWCPPGDVTRDITSALTPRHRELVVFLALHPDGISRDALADALWPDGHAERPFNALHTTLSRLRRALRDATTEDLAAAITVSENRYRLNPDLVDVDYWHLARAVHHSRTATTDQARAAVDRQIITNYRGELGAGLHTDWLDVPREAARRDAIDAAARLARQLADTDPRQTLHLLETARGFDPYNELIYRDIMRLQARLGHHDAISRTLALLVTRLAELDEQPDRATVTLAGKLQRRSVDDGKPTEQTSPSR